MFVGLENIKKQLYSVFTLYPYTCSFTVNRLIGTISPGPAANIHLQKLYSYLSRFFAHLQLSFIIFPLFHSIMLCLILLLPLVSKFITYSFHITYELTLMSILSEQIQMSHLSN